jgi:hypothetical protein
METAGPRHPLGFSPSRKWSLYAGIYAFLCSIVTLRKLSPISDTLVTVLPRLVGPSEFALAAPVPFLGAIVWWAVVERRETYTYLFGGIVGLLTALATVLLWTLVLAIVWGPKVLGVGGVLLVISATLAVSLPVAFVLGLPLMYARRRLDPALD